MEEVIIELPPPISDNERLTIAKIRGRYRMIHTTAAREWMEWARVLIARAWPRETILLPTLKHQLHIKIKCYMPNQRIDASNYTKVVKDAMEKIVYDKDRLVHLDYLDIEIDKKNPRIILKIPILQENKAHRNDYDKERAILDKRRYKRSA